MTLRANIDISRQAEKNKLKTVIIGSSAGGTQALKEIIPSLPEDLPAQFLIVQHMPPVFTKLLAERLDSVSNISVREAEQNEVIKAGVAYIAPGGYHMLVDYDKRKGDVKWLKKYIWMFPRSKKWLKVLVNLASLSRKLPEV